MTIRCSWCGDDPLYVSYHDEEWGVPVRDDQTLFEFLVLEGAQAGLSWITILRKRDGYRRLFDGFNAQKIARYTDNKLDRLLQVDRLPAGLCIGFAEATDCDSGDGQIGRQVVALVAVIDHLHHDQQNRGEQHQRRQNFQQGKSHTLAFA